MRPEWWLPGLAVLAGCATAAAPSPAPAPPPAPSPSSLLLARADRLLVQGDYELARQAYRDFASQYPDDGAAPRAVATRDVLGVLAATSEEVERINGDVLRMKGQVNESEEELARLRRDLGTRENELIRARQELAERQSELARLQAEAERLRADLEKLKNVDLRLERRR
jgi:TolA-binding protein